MVYLSKLSTKSLGLKTLVRSLASAAAAAQPNRNPDIKQTKVGSYKFLFNI